MPAAKLISYVLRKIAAGCLLRCAYYSSGDATDSSQVVVVVRTMAVAADVRAEAISANCYPSVSVSAYSSTRQNSTDSAIANPPRCSLA